MCSARWKQWKNASVVWLTQRLGSYDERVSTIPALRGCEPWVQGGCESWFQKLCARTTQVKTTDTKARRAHPLYAEHNRSQTQVPPRVSLPSWKASLMQKERKVIRKRLLTFLYHKKVSKMKYNKEGSLGIKNKSPRGKCGRRLTSTPIALLVYADVCWRVLTYSDVCWWKLTRGRCLAFQPHYLSAPAPKR
jgi:hypothetical protein